MSLDTLLEAAMYLESSTKSASKVFSASARAANESNTQTRRNRTISESSEGSERRRRPGGAGTRETHNKLEKNRRAHLKECFDILKSEVPGLEDKKTSNLNILRSALKYIQMLKKHEREFEIERDSLKAGNGLLKERLQALKKDIETKDCKRDATKNVMQNELSGKIVSPLNSRLASVEKAGQICPVSVATQTALSPVKTEAPNFLEDLSNASIHSESTESTQEDEYVDIDGCDDDEKHILVDVGGVIEQKEEISKVEENKEGILARKSNGREKKLKRNNIIKYSESVEGAPVVTNGALQDTTLRSRSIFDVDSNGETSQEEFDYDSFKPKIQSCARVSC